MDRNKRTETDSQRETGRQTHRFKQKERGNSLKSQINEVMIHKKGNDEAKPEKLCRVVMEMTDGAASTNEGLAS